MNSYERSKQNSCSWTPLEPCPGSHRPEPETAAETRRAGKQRADRDWGETRTAAPPGVCAQGPRRRCDPRILTTMPADTFFASFPSPEGRKEYFFDIIRVLDTPWKVGTARFKRPQLNRQNLSQQVTIPSLVTCRGPPFSSSSRTARPSWLATRLPDSWSLRWTAMQMRSRP